MKKILIVTAPLNIGGFDIIATELQKNIDKQRFDCTYYINGNAVGPLEKSVIQSGAKIIHKPDKVKGYVQEYIYLKKIMIEGKYDIVHSHLMFYSGIVMRAAYKTGVKKRIPHSHMTNPCMQDRTIIKRAEAKLYSLVMKRWLNKYGTDLIACGPEAGTYLYGKQNFRKRGILLNNAINFDKFRYDKNQRISMRNTMGFKDKLVVGHVGRLNYVKNHKFLLQIFFELQKINPNSILLIVGDGEERKNIEDEARRFGIYEKVIITGVRNDVECLLMAMDVFVFPSLYEGVPVTLVEAQATKLPCLISDTVTKYVRQNENVEYISLHENPCVWAKSAIKLAEKDRDSISLYNLKENYDIKKIAKQLEKIYEMN